jgi:hypothetical protein
LHKNSNYIYIVDILACKQLVGRRFINGFTHCAGITLTFFLEELNPNYS